MEYPPSKCPKKSGCLISCDLLKQRKIYPRVINLSIIVQPIECFWAPYCKPLAINYQLAEAVFGQLLSDIWDSAISSASRKWSCWEVRLDVLKSLPNHWTTSQNRKNDSDMFPMLYIYMDMDECTNNLWNTYEHECIYFFVFALYHVCVGSHKPHSLQYVTQSCCFEPSLIFFYIYISHVILSTTSFHSQPFYAWNATNCNLCGGPPSMRVCVSVDDWVRFSIVQNL